MRFSKRARARLEPTILEIVGGGVSCMDFDQDGLCDLVFARGGAIDSTARQVHRFESGRPAQPRRLAIRRLLKLHSDRDVANLCSWSRPADWDHDGFDDALV